MDGGPTPDAVADLDLRDRAVGFRDTLVLADLHIGQGASSRLELPLGAGADTVDRIQTLLADAAPDRLVLAGDVLHSFDTVPHTVTSALDGIVDAARKHGVQVVALGGNHDRMLETVWDGDLHEEVLIGDTVVCHGDTAPTTEADRYVLGHDHPTIEIEGKRRPCYLAGDGVYRGADVVVLPTFSRLPSGVAVNEMSARDFQSPLIDDADALAPIVLDEDTGETLTFPPLGEFRHRL